MSLEEFLPILISLKTAGLYKIIMTNDILNLKSHPDYPAQVIAEINVVEPSADATLSFLGISHGELNPVFNSNIVKYTANIDKTVQEINITAIPTDSNATVSGDIGWVKIIADTHTYIITVTAENGIATKNYYINANYNLNITTINNEQLTIKNIEVFDIYGKSVLRHCEGDSPKQSRNTTNGLLRSARNDEKGVCNDDSEIVIDISHLQSGIYFIKINNQIVKIIKF